MTMTIYSPGDVLCAANLNADNNETMYAILYNRMEKDYTGATQVDPSIQSDQFCDADGRYNTVCTADTTSTFSTNLYNNCYINTNPTCNCIFCNYCNVSCCVNAYPSYSANTGTNNLDLCISSHVRTCTTTGHYILCGCISGCVYDCNLVNFNNINKFIYSANTTLYGWCFDNSSFLCVVSNFNGCCLTDSISSYCATCKTAVICHEYERINSTTFSYKVNGSLICCTTTPSLSLSTSMVTLTAADYCCGCTGTSGCIINNLTIYSTTNTKIYTNLKNYSTPKNTVILSTNALLPTGNYIKYDIKNQAGTVRLCDASPDVVYALNADTDCCFYAVIKQCVECNLCTPQCMFGYALKMM